MVSNSLRTSRRSHIASRRIIMVGWTGYILRVNLTAKTYKKESFTEEFAHKWVGGRGFAVKILFDEVKPGIDPLGPDNKFIVALGPISGIPSPNTGKAVVAAISPLTGFYGDGNLGTRVGRAPAQGRLRRPDRRGPGRAPDDAVYRGRQGRIPARRRGLGPRHLRLQRLDLRQVRQGRRRPQHRPGRRKPWPASPSSAAWKAGPAAGPGSGP